MPDPEERGLIPVLVVIGVIICVIVGTVLSQLDACPRHPFC